MNEILEDLADALRDEMQEYGELLALLGEQQEAIVTRDIDTVNEIESQVDRTAAEIARRRALREEYLTRAASLVGAPEGRTLSEMLPAFPEALRPMFSALIGEINDLLETTQRKARQNQVLLGKMIETARDVLRTLCPEAVSDTYDRQGLTAALNGRKVVPFLAKPTSRA